MLLLTMRLFTVLIFALISLTNTAVDAADSPSLPSLPIATEDYPPYEMATPKQGLKGFDYELALKIFKRMGYQPKINFLPWERALRHARTGLSVGILTCAYRKEREEFILYSNPISKFTNGYIRLKGNDVPEIKTLEDAIGKKVASIKSYESLKALQDLGVDAIEAPSTELALRMLKNKRFDYLYVNLETAQFIAKELGISGNLISTPVLHQEFHFCFSKKWPNVSDINKQFNAVLHELRVDGTYDKIHSKYK